VPKQADIWAAIGKRTVNQGIESEWRKAEMCLDLISTRSTSG